MWNTTALVEARSHALAPDTAMRKAAAEMKEAEDRLKAARVAVEEAVKTVKEAELEVECLRTGQAHS